MKKQLVSAVALALLVGATGAALAGDLPAIKVKKAPANVNIDGKFDDQWKNATLMTISESDATVKQFGKVWGVPADPCKVWIMWDSTYLYFLAEKEDKVVMAPITDPGAGAPWLDDSIGMFMMYPDGSGFKIPISVPTDSGEMLMGWAPIGPGGAEIKPEIGTAKTVVTPKGYTMEARLKWSEIGDYTPKVGDAAKFTPLIMDKDNDDWGQTMWVGDGDNPEVYADLTFAE